MGNPLPINTHKGTIGELLVQLRLLEYGVQSSSPIKDSGNDLIAIKGEVVKFIQIKTENRLRNLPKIYHVIAFVDLKYTSDGDLLLDKSEVYFINKNQKIKEKQKLTKKLVDEIWAPKSCLTTQG